MTIVGFTGTREGMTDAQKDTVDTELKLLFCGEPLRDQFHHGDCVGSDFEAADMAWWIGYHVVAHPPINEALRGFARANEVLPAKKFLLRNDDIAQICDTLIATPKEYEEVKRSGTWSTIRRARRYRKRIVTVYPSGSWVVDPA